jgi:organic hydroperoxide reductase OsmC/OhrA
MAVKAKRLWYEVSIDGGSAALAAGESIELPDGWEAEHLVLAGLVRCSLTSLRYHARRAGLQAEGSGSASGTITKRDDGRYAFVEIECVLDVTVVPAPEDVPALLAKAERDCFIGASLTVAPRYRWTVNGEIALAS